jgi:hypothetical protein
MEAQPPTYTAGPTASPSSQIIIFALNEHHPVLTSNSGAFPVTQTRKTISKLPIYFKTKPVYDHYTGGGLVALRSIGRLCGGGHISPIRPSLAFSPPPPSLSLTASVFSG